MSKKPDHHMFGRWFRFYCNAVDNPKVQRLPDATFKTWVNLLCIAGTNSGAIPDLIDVAFKLRLSEKETKKRITVLVEAGLLDETEEGHVIHDWDERQFVSDASNERVKKYREKRKRLGLPG